MSSTSPNPRADQGSADASMDAGLQEATTNGLLELTQLNDPIQEVEVAEPDAGLQVTLANVSQHMQVNESQEQEAEVEVDRMAYIKKKMEENQMKIAEIAKMNHMSAVARKDLGKTDDGQTTTNLLTMRMAQAINLHNGVGVSASQKGKYAPVVLIQHGVASKKSVRPITLPKVEKIPPYTTWLFTDRNEKMRQDQAVLGRRRLYYDPKEGETLIFTDSEDETPDNDNNKIELVESADKSIRSTADQPAESSNYYPERHRDLEAAGSSFDRLFCSRCIIFGCKLHGCSQQIIYPAEQKGKWKDTDDIDEDVPCGPFCYLKMEANAGIPSESRMHVDDVTPNSSPSNKEKNAGKSIESKEPEESSSSSCSSSSLPNAKILSRSHFEPWGTFEKSLLRKGIEIFGRRSCLIARNITFQVKTCAEVYQALQYQEDNRSNESDENTGTSSVRPHATMSQIYEEDLECRRQYNPCGCQSSCGDDCSCLKNNTVCEKFCGCPKACKNRYKGCYCAKGKCGTRQCPCFAINRECDPDVCRNCWISCGDGTLGNPSKEGGFECDNMKMLLNQKKQKLLLGRSNVAGWGLFARNDVAKDEYLGEYTGELISHREADKRGKVYDHEDSSYLFNLNDQFVVDGKRMGSKLKFINHSFKPNCYMKVNKVVGDHRVGVFAKKKIRAGEELFCDYGYEVDNAPSWAKEPEDNDLEETDGTASSSKRAKRVS